MNAIMEPIFLTQCNQAEVRMIGNSGSMNYEPCRSRWGWHACSHDVYLKLKKIKKAYFDALRQSANFRRWARKTVRQSESAPEVNPAFLVKQRWEKKIQGRDAHGQSIIGMRWNPAPVDPGCFLDLFDKARKPHGHRVDPFDSLILGAIDEKYAKLKELGYVG